VRPSYIKAILEREFLAAATGHHTPAMVWGPPGIGKSQIVSQIAQRHRVPLIDIRLSQMEPTDLRGIPFRTRQGVKWSIPILLPDVNRHGHAGILFLDEITSAMPTVTAAAYQLILDRRLGEYNVPAGWVIFAAGNRQGDRGVSYQMPAPLANRFTHYEMEVHLDDWVAWAHSAGLDDRLIAFLRFRPDLLFDFDPVSNALAFPSPRSWEYAHRALLKFADSPELLSDALQACVGPAAGIELKAFMDHIRDLPDVDGIVQGRVMHVPGAIDLQYAVAAALVRRAVQAKEGPEAKRIYGNVLRYARRFPQREMSVMLVTDMQRSIGEPLVSLPEFSDWATSMSDLMLYEMNAR
jgi:dynein-related subfamily AAA family protein